MSSSVPPSATPPSGGQSGQPEYLGTDPTPSGRGRRNALIGGGIVGAVAVIGGGAWAASWFLSSGASASEMLPAATVAYVEVNLDPSGSQKIAALDTLNKFPAFADEVGIGSRDDLRQKLFELVQEDGACAGLDYSADIKPWLGDRAALAAVDEGGKEPVAVVVLEVSDESKASSGLTKLGSCDDGDDVGFVVSDGWAVVAETKAEAQKALDLAGKDTLADDSDYQDLTAAAGSAGVMTAYVSPDAGSLLADLASEASPAAAGSADRDALEDFGGLALQVRFDDDGLEVESVSDNSAAQDSLSSKGVQAVTGLPDGTGVALGVALEAGWGDRALDSVLDSLGAFTGDLSRDDVVKQIEQATGLTVPDDLETLLGSSTALAVSGDLDVDAIANSSDPSSLPVGLRIVGDADQVSGVLDKIRNATGQSGLIQSTSDGDRIAVGPDSDWNAELVREGTLGDSSTFEEVLPDADKAAVVLYLDADANDEWLVRALKGSGLPADVTDNVEPVKAVGAEAWVDGDLVHGRLTLATD